MNKSTSCWWALERIFPNGQTAPELPVTVFSSLTLEAAGAEHSESECQSRQTCFDHFYISSKRKRYCYTIQLGMCDSELAEFEKENRASYLIISFNRH